MLPASKHQSDPPPSPEQPPQPTSHAQRETNADGAINWPVPLTIALYHGPLYASSTGYETYGPYARYVGEFARRFSRVVVIAPVTRDESTAYRGCALPGGNVEVVELPAFDTHVQASLHIRALWRAFRRALDGVDGINCRNTAPFGYLLYYLARRRGVGFFYHFTSDPAAIIREGRRFRGAYGWFARLAYAVDFAVQKRVMRRTYSFINGRTPFERFKGITDRTEMVISSTLTKADLRPRETAALHDPVRLLYVGYFKHMKGLEHLVDAVALLRKRGLSVELHLVGTGPTEAAIRSQIAKLGLADHVRLHGYVPMGVRLNRHYDDADVFVFPSLAEGSPRVVLEAMAHSLPVVSTPVGSVPDLIEHGKSGLIAKPGSADSLADAVQRFIRDDDLRCACMKAGFHRVREHTVERFVGKLAAKAVEIARHPSDER